MLSYPVSPSKSARMLCVDAISERSTIVGINDDRPLANDT